MAEWDSGTKATVQKIPLLAVIIMRTTPLLQIAAILHCSTHCQMRRKRDTAFLLTAQVSAGPRDKEGWAKRFREVRSAWIC